MNRAVSVFILREKLGERKQSIGVLHLLCIADMRLHWRAYRGLLNLIWYAC